MGIFTYESEIVVAVPPTRLFKAYVLDDVNLFPKVIPGMKIELLQGTGGAGTIKKITFPADPAGGAVSYAKHKIDLIDQANLTYNYTIIEGDVLGQVVEKLEFKTKIVASSEGGSIWKATATFHTKGDAVVTVEKFKAGEERAKGLYKAVEAYLLANPDAYN